MSTFFDSLLLQKQAIADKINVAFASLQPLEEKLKTDFSPRDFQDVKLFLQHPETYLKRRFTPEPVEVNGFALKPEKFFELFDLPDFEADVPRVALLEYQFLKAENGKCIVNVSELKKKFPHYLLRPNTVVSVKSSSGLMTRAVVTAGGVATYIAEGEPCHTSFTPDKFQKIADPQRLDLSAGDKVKTPEGQVFYIDTFVKTPQPGFAPKVQSRQQIIEAMKPYHAPAEDAHEQATVWCVLNRKREAVPAALLKKV